MRYRLFTFVSLSLCWMLSGVHAQAVTSARYRGLPGEGGYGANFQRVIITVGPDQQWQLDIYEKDTDSEAPMMQLRARTTTSPFEDRTAPLEFTRYQLRIPPTEEAYDYRDANHPERALVPTWGDFDQWFVPRPSRATNYTKGFPNTCRYLGHVLSLREVKEDVEWQKWDDLKVVELDRELWIATSRTFKDQEERRLPDAEKTNYHYERWTKKDYETLIDAGMNVFGLNPGIEKWLRSKPVFYRRGFKGDEPLRWPADFYRTNNMGPVLYLDEPSCRISGNSNFYDHSIYFTDFLAALVSRVSAEWRGKQFELERDMRRGENRISFGSMRLAQADFVTWDTRYSTAYYQCIGGAKAFVHEGRYQLDEFDRHVEATTGLKRKHTPEEMFRYIYGMMRGSTRPFGADWGTAIYGQADPKLNPLAVKLAYDMGARFIWYWTSDHGHHLPWPEQLELTRIVCQHAEENPRPSIRGPQPTRDLLITVPYGYLPVLESPTNRQGCWDLWWVRELDPEKKNEASQRYRKLMRNLFIEVHKAFDEGKDFDISINGEVKSTGYRDIIHVTDE